MNRNDVLEKQQILMKKLEEWCGEIPPGQPLDLVEKERREYRTHTEIKLHYNGDPGEKIASHFRDPGERIPAYLLIPRGIGTERRPAIFAAHQCAWACDIGKEQVVGKSVDWPDQAYGLELVREGFVVLAPDTNHAGERFKPALRKQWQTAADLGNSQHACCLAGGGSWWPNWKRIYDVRRGVDVLSQHPNVDPDRIGMIGHSNGAGITLWAMPFEPRVKAGVISGGGLMGHPNASDEKGWPFGVSFLDLLRVLAPRPLFEALGNEDYLNFCQENQQQLPVPERMRAKYDAYETAKEFYDSYGVKDPLELFVFDGGHHFPVEARKASYAFLKKHLSLKTPSS